MVSAPLEIVGARFLGGNGATDVEWFVPTRFPGVETSSCWGCFPRWIVFAANKKAMRDSGSVLQDNGPPAAKVEAS